MAQRLTIGASDGHEVILPKTSPSMSGHSGGTLTMLHTDIENSTSLTRHLGEKYPAVLATHRRLLRTAFAAYDGREVDSQGDAFFVVFRSPAQAVAAAVQIQRALAAQPWPQDGAVRVRIGIHTGEPIRTAEGYTGLDVIRAARIKEAGHGGQVLLSASTAAMIQHALLEELGLRDLGTRLMKNLPDPERIFQLLIPDLPADFPPLQAFPGPPEVTIAPVAADVPSELAAYSGTWEGAWGNMLQSRLVVEKIDAESARAMYAWADDSIGRFKGGWARVKAKVLPGGKLQWGDEVKFTFQMAPDRMSITGEREDAQSFAIVTMRKVLP